MADKFEGFAAGVDSTTRHHWPITPGTAFADTTRAVYAGAACTVNATDASGADLEGFPLTQGCNPVRFTAIASVDPDGTALFGGE